ncbi:alanyl-tRNA editing protein [Metabacillus rhizolycopersici]|uniref:Alanyl-tRNA editing protein n=1 Tax=Metabacillus rhizolycopersici TaxID=2875709 RepID=A0ABS7UUL0_9BACI|nr:DHHA1 domain-containing protein [Metabacillus rhizolycopersici]MBZ5751841.1 alanyl-tRNA editing protein [Metabacillus rhizolycopersici]
MKFLKSEWNLMTTEKIYYDDQYKQSFKTNLVKQDQNEDGRLYVVLEKTAFYPTGGGQPHDTGTLNDVQVYDVEEIDGEIRHYVERSLDEHENIVGQISWERRFDHMQQHSGQHILSAAFEDVYGYKTISFHLGKDHCTIDLEVPNLTEEEVNQTETLVNEVILENRLIEAKWVSEEDLSHYSLRKELSVSENIRLVMISNFDNSGCGGTHPSSTAEVGAIKILHWEKQKRNIRVYFVCGARVMKQLQVKHQVIQSLTSVLNAPQEKLIDAANQIRQYSKNLEKKVDELKNELLTYEANKHIDHAQLKNNQKIVQSIYENRSISELQQLSRLITSMASDVIVFFISENEDKFQLVCTRGKDLDINMKQVLKEVLPVINGKGGGNDSLAQGGGERIIEAEHLMEELMKVSLF